MDLRQFIENGDPHYDLKQEIMTFKTEADAIDRFLGYQADGLLKYKIAYAEDEQAAKEVKAMAVKSVLSGGEPDSCSLFREICEELWEDTILTNCRNTKGLVIGDTMNSASTTLNRWCGAKSTLTLLWHRHFDSEWAKMQLEPTADFLDACYTIGNLIPIPKNRDFTTKTNDYWDLTLLGVYNHYVGNKDAFWNLEKVFGKSWEEYLPWLEAFGSWSEFVRQNFMDSFVEENSDGFGKPKELWDGHFSPKAFVLPQYGKDYLQFFERATKMIHQRSDDIYKALKGKQKQK